MFTQNVYSLNERTKPSFGSILSAVFLVAGTCIGGGMLALPVSTGAGGFFPSLGIMALCWLAMTATALLLLEASLWMKKEDAHVITITNTLLGAWGKSISWVLYLFICYASLVAYTAAGGELLRDFFSYFSDFPLSRTLSCISFMLLFGWMIDLGTRLVGRINSILFIGLIVAYVLLIGMGIPEIQHTLLVKQKNWGYSILAIPVLLTAFSFQTMVPSLTPYLQHDSKALRWAIIGGTSLSFLIYAIWQGLVLGIVPVDGTDGLLHALEKGEPATVFLRKHVGGEWTAAVAEYFAFFALVTSFLGIGLGLFDFLSDGLNMEKKGGKKLFLGALIALPTLFFAIKYERIFLAALETSGGIGDSILNGILPVLLVWTGRYKLGYVKEHPILLKGGKVVLLLILLFFIFSLFIQLKSLSNSFFS